MKHFRNSSHAEKGLRQAPKPPVARMARSYQSISSEKVDRQCYPSVGTDTVVPSIHVVPLVQGIFANDNNFSSDSHCNVFEIRFDATDQPIGSWRQISGDAEMLTLSQVSDYLKATAVTHSGKVD